MFAEVRLITGFTFHTHQFDLLASRSRRQHRPHLGVFWLTLALELIRVPQLQYLGLCTQVIPKHAPRSPGFDNRERQRCHGRSRTFHPLERGHIDKWRNSFNQLRWADVLAMLMALLTIVVLGRVLRAGKIEHVALVTYAFPLDRFHFAFTFILLSKFLPHPTAKVLHFARYFPRCRVQCNHFLSHSTPSKSSKQFMYVYPSFQKWGNPYYKWLVGMGWVCRGEYLMACLNKED